jgi:hypothetical protein
MAGRWDEAEFLNMLADYSILEKAAAQQGCLCLLG